MKLWYISPLFLTIPLIATPGLAVEELIVTGSYNPVHLEQLSSSVSIIDQKQLVQLSRTSLIDALRQIPSIWVEEQGGPGGITSIILRGAESNHTLVLLDGVQLNDPTNTRGGAFDLGGINIESVNRIEIIRGAQSSIYGSDALAGVIHIITNEPVKPLTGIHAAVGEDGYQTAGINTSGKLSNIAYLISAQTKDSGEPLTGSEARNKEFLTKLNWALNANEFELHYRYFSGERLSFPEQSGGPLFATERTLDVSDFTDQSGALGWRLQVQEAWQSKVQATWYQREEEFNSPGIAPFDAVPANGANTDFTRTHFSWINTLGNEKSIWANLGIETKKEEGDSHGYLDFGVLVPTDFTLSRRVNSGFFNLNGYATDKLLMQASIRRDDTNEVHAGNSVQTGARYQVNANFHWFANWGEGFKLPSFFALGHPLVGNPNLQPEQAETWDTGVEWTHNTVTTRMSYFNHEYRDLVDFDSETFTNVNRSRVDSSGVESEVNWQASSQWLVRVHGTYTDIDMLSSDNHLLGRPQVKAGTSLHYTPNTKWNINLNYLWVDERFAVSRYTGDSVEQTLDTYERFDASVNWQFNSQTRLGVSVENFADEKYYTDIGFPAIGRTAKLNMSFTF